MAIQFLDGTGEQNFDKYHYVKFDLEGSMSFLHKSSLLFYLIENDLPYNEEDFIGVKPIDYSDNLVKEELKEISTELLKQELEHRGYATKYLWGVNDIESDLSDDDKLILLNKVLNSEGVTEYIKDVLKEYL